MNNRDKLKDMSLSELYINYDKTYDQEILTEVGRRWYIKEKNKRKTMKCIFSIILIACVYFIYEYTKNPF